MTEIEQQIAVALSRYAGYPLAAMTADTQIWHDARLGGDDFGEFIAWCWSTFGLVLPGRAQDYAPPEPGPFGDMWRFLRKPRQYQPLSIGNLAALAQDARESDH